MVKKYGIFLISLGIVVYFADLIMNHALAKGFAQFRCGDSYLQFTSFTDGQEVVNSYACGMDASESMLTICLAVVLCGVMLVLIPLFHKK